MSGVVTQNVLGSSGLVKAPEAGGGAWVEIKTLTSDGSDATMSFVNGTDDVVLDSTYSVYCFRFITIHPETDNTHFQVGFRDGGTEYDATKSSTAFYARHKEDDSATAFAYDGGQDLAQGTGFQYLWWDTGSDNDQAANGHMYLFAPSSTTFIKHFFSRCTSSANNDWAYDTYIAGYCNVTAAIDAVQFKMSSGEIQGGKIKLFGIKDS